MVVSETQIWWINWWKTYIWCIITPSDGFTADGNELMDFCFIQWMDIWWRWWWNTIYRHSAHFMRIWSVVSQGEKCKLIDKGRILINCVSVIRFWFVKSFTLSEKYNSSCKGKISIRCLTDARFWVVKFFIQMDIQNMPQKLEPVT